MDAGFRPAPGGCACGAVRFTLQHPPLYVHACHCTRCQRETGGPLAHHAVVAWCDMQIDSGAVEYTQVPSDSGTRHWVARCPGCRTALWNEWGSRRAVTRYVRVGVLDEPARFPPLAHIFVRSKQPWVCTDGAPAFETCYPADQWPAENRARWQQARQRARSTTAPDLAVRGRRAKDAGG